MRREIIKTVVVSILAIVSYIVASDRLEKHNLRKNGQVKITTRLNLNDVDRKNLVQ